MGTKSASIGDNSDPVDNNELRLLVERIERLEDEKKGIADDIKDVYGEAKARGFDAKIMKQVINSARRSPTTDRRRELCSTPTVLPLASTSNPSGGLGPPALFRRGVRVIRACSRSSQ